MLTHTTAESKQKLDAASSLRDTLDHYTNGPAYPMFLKKTMPPFVNILRGACVFQTTSVEQVCDNQHRRWYILTEVPAETAKLRTRNLAPVTNPPELARTFRVVCGGGCRSPHGFGQER